MSRPTNRPARTKARQTAGAIGLALVLAGAFAGPAEAYTQGPMNWPAGFSSERYPRHAGVHQLSMYHCGTKTNAMELRVDVVNRQDIGYGLKAYTCGTTRRSITSNIDSYESRYRGHFMQVRDGFYGTLRDA